MREPQHLNDGCLKGRRLLVTGGAGFIGSHVVERALALGAKVRVLDDFSTGSERNLRPFLDRIEVVEADVAELAACQTAMRGVDSVVHFAAIVAVEYSLQAPARTLAVNVTGTANILQAAHEAGAERVVYASSSSVYGDAPAPHREGHEGTPGSPYALSKLMAEHLAAQFYRCYGLSALGLRFFNVYGPRQSADSYYAAVVSRFLHAASRREPLTIHGTGNQSRDFVYVHDVAAATLVALTSAQTTTGVFNVGTGKPTTIRELASSIQALLPGLHQLRSEAARENDILLSLADMKRFEQSFGWRPETPLAEGLKATAEPYLTPRASE